MVEDNSKISTFREKMEIEQMHYHGDKVRVIFMVMAVLMLLTAPLFRHQLQPLSEFYSIFGILVLSLIAGLTNPRSKLFIMGEFLIAMAALIVFGFQTLHSYSGSYTNNFFVTNLVLALLSLFALYLSSKTLRGKLLSHK